MVLPQHLRSLEWRLRKKGIAVPTQTLNLIYANVRTVIVRTDDLASLPSAVTHMAVLPRDRLAGEVKFRYSADQPQVQVVGKIVLHPFDEFRHEGDRAGEPPRGGRWVTHLHIKLVSGLECIYISEAGKENPKRGQIVRDKCLNSGSMAFGLAKVSANPSPLAVCYFDLVGGRGVVVQRRDARKSRGNLIWAFDLGFWEKSHRIGQGAGVGTRTLLRKGTACLLPRLIAPDC